MRRLVATLRWTDCWPYAVVVAAVAAANSLYLSGYARLDPLITRSGLASSIRPGPVVGQYTIDPNDGFTAQALGRAALHSWAEGRLPWWNHFEGLGSPLIGEMQAAAISPLLVLMGLPNGFLLYHLTLDVIAGLATVRLCRALGLRRSPSAVAGVLFGLNGTLIWLMNASSAPVPFLPVLLLGVVRCVEGARSGRRTGIVTVGVALWLSIVQGFPEAAYLSGLLAAALAVHLCWNHRSVALGIAARLAIGLALGVALAAPALVGFGTYVTNGADVGNHTGRFSELGLPYQASGMLAAPYAFGQIFAHTTPASLGFVWGNVGGYTSALVVLLAAAGLVGRQRRGLRLLLGGWVMLALAKTFALPLLTPALNQIPGMRLVAFYRYANPSWTLALILLVALALQDLLDLRLADTARLSAAWAGFTVVGAGYAVARVTVSPAHTTEPGILRWFHVSYGWAALSVVVGLILLFLGKKRPRLAVGALGALLAIEATVMFSIPSFSAPRSWVADDRMVAFFQKQAAAASTAEGFARFYSIGGPLAPNYGSYFGAPQLNVNDVPVPRLWVDFVHQVDPSADPSLFLPIGRSPSGFSHRYAVLRDHVDAFRNADVRWVVTQVNEPAPSDLASVLHRVLETDTAIVYELSNPSPYVTTSGGCTFTSRSPDTFHVRCTKPGQLLRRELWMQGWEASIAGSKSNVSRNGSFQQVSLPAGESDLVFHFAPPGSQFAEAMAVFGLLAVILLLGVRPRFIPPFSTGRILAGRAPRHFE